jgi:hydroxymethylpyrimidine/phosphomethylpyrimidine kinase
MIARALTIAGSDSSGGAGIQADLKTFTVFGAYGMSAITALTAQNTTGVAAIHAVPAPFVRQQIDAVVTDIGVDAVKTGMLANRVIIETVAAALRDHRIERVVVDPVLLAQSGAALLEDDARSTLLRALIPLASLVTPNIPEAAALLAMAIESEQAMHTAARRFVELGARAALIKGGHLAGADAVDVLYDGSALRVLRAPRIQTPHTHGTGCMLSAAITAGLAHGKSLASAVEDGKRFITAAVTQGLAIGKGHGPANVLAWLEE